LQTPQKSTRGYCRKHAAEYNDQYFTRRHPLQIPYLCIKFSENSTIKGTDTDKPHTKDKSIFHFFHILAKKNSGFLFGLLWRERFPFCLPVARCQNVFNFHQIKRKPCSDLTLAPCFLYSHSPKTLFFRKERLRSSIDS
jgi:hypothetical protein